MACNGVTVVPDDRPPAEDAGADARVTIESGAAEAGSPGSDAADVVSTGARTAPPVFTPEADKFDDAICVTMASATPGATIYYTTDGLTPTTASPSSTYSAPLVVSDTTAFQAIAVAPGLAPSYVVGRAYFVVPRPGAFGAPVAFTPAAGEYTGPVDVELSTISDGTICYTTDGSAPTCAPPPGPPPGPKPTPTCSADGGVIVPEGGSSNVPCTGTSQTFHAGVPIHLTPPDGGTVMLKAMACSIGNNSDITTATYTFTP